MNSRNIEMTVIENYYHVNFVEKFNEVYLYTIKVMPILLGEGELSVYGYNEKYVKHKVLYERIMNVMNAVEGSYNNFHIGYIQDDGLGFYFTNIKDDTIYFPLFKG